MKMGTTATSLSASVLIQNPTKGGAARIGRERAERYIRNQRAKWVGDNAIRFIECPQDRAVRLSAERADKDRLALTHTDYDRVRRLMTVRELSGLPMCMPTRALVGGPSRVVAGRNHYRNGPGRVIRTIQEVTA